LHFKIQQLVAENVLVLVYLTHVKPNYKRTTTRSSTSVLCSVLDNFIQLGFKTKLRIALEILLCFNQGFTLSNQVFKNKP